MNVHRNGRVALLIAALACLAGAAWAGGGGEASLWEVWQESFEAQDAAAAKSPLDVELTVELTAPSGKKHQVAGFWDGGRTWRVRFMPDEAGTWSYRSTSRPAIAGLDGQSGRFSCEDRPALHNRLFRRGPVRVAKAGTHLEHADGVPMFWLGDTVWNGPMLATESDWRDYLADRVAKRFTVVQYNALAPWRTAPADEKGEVAFTGRSDVQINPVYFQRLDQRVAAINRAGLLAAPVLVWALKKEDPGNYLPEADCLRLVRYQLARYGAYHVVWILAGDNPYRGESAERWQRIGRAVFAGPHAPATTHPTGMNWPWESWRGERWLDIFGYQSGHGDDAKTLAWLHSGPVRDAWQKSPPRPIINLEPPYEDHVAYQSKQRHSDYSVRRAIYWSLLVTPTAGVTYGGHGMWSWQTEAGPPRDHPYTGIAKPWREAKDLPGAQQMKHLRNLIEGLPWWKLRPEPELLAEQPGRDDPAQFVAAARAGDGSAALLYLPAGGTVKLAKSPQALGLGRAEWFDPRTGQRRPAAAEGAALSAPDANDWLLVLQPVAQTSNP